MNCQISKDLIRDKIATAVSDLAVGTGLFTSENRIITPIGDMNERHRDIITNINTSFQDLVLKPENDTFRIDIPQDLVDSTLKTYNKENSNNDTNIVEKSNNSISEEDLLKLVDAPTPLDFLNKYSPHQEQIQKFLAANPSVKLQFGDGFSQFDPSSNTVNISLSELYEASEVTGIPFKQVVSIYIEHELAHAASFFGLDKGKNAEEMQKILDIVKLYNKTNKFEDVLRQGQVGIDGLPYAFSNIHELAAETFANPYLKDYLKKIPYKNENKSVWDKIVDFFRTLLGFDTKDNAYDSIIDYINSDKISSDNVEGSETPYAQELVMTYRGNPKNYIDATNEFFNSGAIKAQVTKAMENLPAALIEIKKKLSKETNKQEADRLQSLLNAYNEIKGKGNEIAVYVNMLAQVAKVANDIDTQLNSIDKLPEDKRIHARYSAWMAVKSLESMTPIVADVLNIMKTEGAGKETKRFMDNLRGIGATIDAANRNFGRGALPSMLRFFSSLNMDAPALNEIQGQIDVIKDKLKNGNLNENDKKFYNDKIDKLTKQLLSIPSNETFEKIFSGNFTDASAPQMNLETIYFNSHPLVSSVASEFRDLDISITAHMLAIENRAQKALDEVVKNTGAGLRNPSITWAPIKTEFEDVGTIEEGEDGKLKIVPMKRKMFLSSYSPEYLGQLLKLQAVRDFYFDKFLEAKRANDDVNQEKYQGMYEESIRAQKSFQRENSELPYQAEVYQMYDLIDKDVIKEDGTKTSFRKERGDIFGRIEDYENRRDTSTTFQEQKDWQDSIDQEYIDLREIRSRWDEFGKEKVGSQLEIANIANQYYELRGKYGVSVLTDEGMASFEREVQDIEARFKSGNITQEQRDASINNITVTEVDPSFFEEMDKLAEQIHEATNKLIAIPEIATALKDVNKDKIKEGYQKIRQLTSPFRDNEGVIDGILFSKVRPELVKEIKNLQQEAENLKSAAAGLRGLSIDDSIELRKLQARADLNDEEQARKSELAQKAADTNTLYKNNRRAIDEYNLAINKLSGMRESAPSKYYIQEKDNQLNLLINSIKNDVRKEAMSANVLEDGKYYRTGDSWFKIDRTDEETGTKYVIPVEDKEGYTALEQVVDEIAKARADKNLTQTDWWKDNHYNVYFWDVESKSHSQVERPIYIWVKTEPKDKSYIKTKQPSQKFKTYKIHDGSYDDTKNYLNPAHRNIMPFTPINKAGKYDNVTYNSLKNSTDSKDKAYYKYLEFLRAEYYEGQKDYPPNKQMGDILPGIVKTHDELKVESTNKALKISTYKNLLQFGAEGDKNEDTALLLHGGQSKFYSSSRTLPTRFTGRISAEKQSDNLPGMILAFTLAAKRFATYSEIHPVLETLRTVVQDLSVQQVATLTKSFSLRGMFSAAKSEAKTVSTGKEAGETVLAKTINYMLDTFMYEERKDESNFTAFGMNVDLQKTSSSLKRLSSTALFALKLFIPIKNTISGKVQSVINSHIGKGFYTNSDYLKGQIDARKYVKNFVQDYKKFGDKSFIGQALQYFQVLSGYNYNEYGKKTQWTNLKNAENYLTLLKNVSEFELQATQFLAMSRANKVDLNGQKVQFLDAFELNKEGNFAPKQGTNIPQEDINQFIKKVSYVNRVINGAYRQDERAKFQKTVLGDLAFYLNGFIVPGFVNRFAGTRYSPEADMITRGYWSQTGEFIKDLIKYRRGIATQWNELNGDEKARVMRFSKELGFVIGFLLLTMALGSGQPKKELANNSFFQNYMLALSLAVKSETETFTPLPGFGLDDMARKLNSPFAAVRQITNIVKVLNSGMSYIVQSDNAFYKTTGIHDGFHDKGDAKVVANFLRLIGYTGVELDPLEKVSRIRQFQQLK